MDILGDAKINKKEIRRLRSELISERSRTLKPLEVKMTELENIIDAHEKQLEGLNHLMQSASENKDANQIAYISKSIHQFQNDIDHAFGELESLAGLIDEKRLAFDLQMRALNDLEATQN
jgi:ATP-binding cassette subfamily F protein 3